MAETEQEKKARLQREADAAKVVNPNAGLGFKEGEGPGTKNWKDDPRRVNPSEGHPDPRDTDPGQHASGEGPLVDETPGHDPKDPKPKP